MPGTTTGDGPIAAASSTRPGLTAPPLTSPSSGSSAGLSSAASSTNTSEPHRSPGQEPVAEFWNPTGAAPRSRRAAAAEPGAEAGLGRPGDARRPGPAAPQAAADGPPGDARYAAALAP